MRPTLLGIVPYAGLSFMTFETLKSRIRHRNRNDHSSSESKNKNNGDDKDKGDIPIGLRLLAGGTAGLVAQSATYPLDIVRRRMQVGVPYAGIRHAFQEIVKHEGFIQGMYKGLVMNWFKGPVAVGVSFVTNDLVKNFFLRRRGLQTD